MADRLLFYRTFDTVHHTKCRSMPIFKNYSSNSLLYHKNKTQNPRQSQRQYICLNSEPKSTIFDESLYESIVSSFRGYLMYNANYSEKPISIWPLGQI